MQNEFENIKQYPVRKFSDELFKKYVTPKNLIDEPSPNLDEDIIIVTALELQEKLGVSEKTARKMVGIINSYLLETLRFSENMSKIFGIPQESAEYVVRMGYRTLPQIVYSKPSNIQRRLEKKISREDINKILRVRSEIIRKKNKEIEDIFREIHPESIESIDSIFDEYLNSLDPLIYKDILSIEPNLAEVISYFTSMAEKDKLENVSPAILRDQSLIKKVDDLFFTLEEWDSINGISEPLYNSFISLDVYAHTITNYLSDCYGIRTEFKKIIDGLQNKVKEFQEIIPIKNFFKNMDKYTNED